MRFAVSEEADRCTGQPLAFGRCFSCFLSPRGNSGRMKYLPRHVTKLVRKPGILVSLLAGALWASSSASASTLSWNPAGPDGGDARSLAAAPGTPGHLFLGTTNSWIYESTDGAQTWHRLAHLASDDTLIVDHIVIDRSDPSLLFAAAWT